MFYWYLVAMASNVFTTYREGRKSFLIASVHYPLSGDILMMLCLSLHVPVLHEYKVQLGHSIHPYLEMGA